MMAATETQRASPRLLRFLSQELAPREGRAAAVARIAISCTITVVIAMVFRIPLPAYMAYIVFLISKDELAATIRSAVGAMLALTVAVILCLLLFMIDAAEPALRLPAMAAATFIAMYTSRTLALGPITYLAGFVLVLLQTLIDDVPQLEALTRITLWLWVVGLVPVTVAIVINLLAGQRASLLIERTVLRILTEVQARLRGNRPALATLAEQRAELLLLFAQNRGDPSFSTGASRINETVIRRLLDALVMLEVIEPGVPQVLLDDLADRIAACRAMILNADSDLGMRPFAQRLTQDAPAVVALRSTLAELHDAIGRSAPAAEAKAPKPPFLRPDALSNPEYVRFALKSTLAVMSVYAIYTLLNYPGLRTSIVTCFFVALASLGESVHKLVLRISGAAIGGLIAALCIVFILPSLTDIGQLSLLIAAVVTLCAWVATSSERLSYAGMQIAFAFFLGVLQGYGPATDLTVLRDRVTGILLGNIAVTIIFSLVWPESAATRVQAALAELLRVLATVLRGEGSADAERLRATEALARANQYALLREFELSMLTVTSPLHPGLDIRAATRLLGSSLLVTNSALLPYSNPQLMAERARWADEASHRAAKGAPVPEAPRAPLAVAAGAGSSASRADQELQSAIEHVVKAS